MGNYEIFTRTKVSTVTPTISINKQCRIGLNRATTAIFETNAVQFVLLMWDAQGCRMAFRPIVKKDTRAYGISYAKQGAMFTAKMFLVHIGYDFSESHTFPATWNESENMLEIDIPSEYIKDAPSKQGKLLPVDNTRKSTDAAKRHVG